MAAVPALDAEGLVRALGPLVGVATRPRLAALGSGEAQEVAVRYDEVRDWSKFHQVLETVDWWDGPEFILLRPRK